MQSQTPETAAATTPFGEPPGKGTKTRQKLTTSRDCHMLLARYVRLWMNGEVRIDDVSKLANILQIQARLIDGASLADRVEQLEEAIAKQHGGNARRFA